MPTWCEVGVNHSEAIACDIYTGGGLCRACVEFGEAMLRVMAEMEAETGGTFTRIRDEKGRVIGATICD